MSRSLLRRIGWRRAGLAAVFVSFLFMSLTPGSQAGTPSAPNPPSLRALRLLGTAGEFRGRAALSLDNALSSVAGAEKMDFIRKAAPYQAKPYAWAYFFSGTFVLLGNPDEIEPVVAFYNPYLDAALMTRWRIDPAKKPPAIRDAFFCYGADFSAGKKGAAGVGPRWVSGSKDVGSALSRQHQSFVAAFDRRFSANVSNHAAFDGLKETVAGASSSNMEALAVLQVSLLRELYRPDGGYADQLDAVRSGLAGGNPALLRKIVPAGNPLAAEELANLPEEFRNWLVPLFVIPGKENVIVLMVSQKTLKFGALLNYRTTPAIAVGEISIYGFDTAAEAKR